MNWKLALVILSVNSMLMGASYTMVMPFLPLYLRDLGADADTLQLWNGVVFAVTFAVSALMAPVWGKFTDRFGAKNMLLRAGFLMAVSYLCGILAQTPLQLFGVRILQGFSAGLWPATLSLLSGYAPKDKLGICMGTVQSTHVAGFMLGPVMGGFLAGLVGIRACYAVGLCFYLAVFFLALIILREPESLKTARKNATEKASYRLLLKDRGILFLLVTVFCIQIVLLLLQPILTLYVRELHDSEDHLTEIVGVIFALASLGSVIGAPLWGWLGQRRGFFAMLLATLTLSGLTMFCFALPASLTVFAALQLLFGLLFAGATPMANSLLIKSSAPQMRGSAFGLMFCVQYSGSTLGPLLGGVLTTCFALSSVFYVGAALLTALALLLFAAAPPALRTAGKTDS